MNPIGISIVRTDETSVYANYYYDEGPTVYIEILGINSPNSEWRISGRHSLGDTEIYLYGQGLGTFSFDSSDKKSYVLQIQNWNNDWVNSTNMYGEPQENSIINVDFEYGGNGGDSGDGSWEEAGKNKLHINEGNGTKITVQRTWSDFGDYGNVYLSDGDTIYYPADRFQITAEALPGYKIDYYTSDDGEYLPFIMDNLTKPYAGEPYQLSRNLDVTVSATATRSTNIRIDDGSSFDNRYYCYIDTEHVEDVELISDGVFSSTSVGDFSSNTMTWSSYGNNNAKIGDDNYTHRYSSCFKFSPSVTGSSKYINISLKLDDTHKNDLSGELGYALCTSDKNKSKYITGNKTVDDEYQVACGSFNKSSLQIVINTDQVFNGITYYLFIWAYEYLYQKSLRFDLPENQTFSICSDSGEVRKYCQFDLYIPYIDNGTSWEPF